jgi:hypothetical protein
MSWQASLLPLSPVRRRQGRLDLPFGSLGQGGSEVSVSSWRAQSGEESHTRYRLRLDRLAPQPLSSRSQPSRVQGHARREEEDKSLAAPEGFCRTRSNYRQTPRPRLFMEPEHRAPSATRTPAPGGLTERQETRQIQDGTGRAVTGWSANGWLRACSEEPRAANRRRPWWSACFLLYVLSLPVRGHMKRAASSKSV